MGCANRRSSLHLAVEKRPGIGPPAVSGGPGDLEDRRRLVDRQAGEEPQRNQPGLVRVLAFEPSQGFVQRQEINTIVAGDRNLLGQFLLLTTAAMLKPAIPPGAFDEDAAHGPGGSGEEMAAVLPAGI